MESPSLVEHDRLRPLRAGRRVTVALGDAGRTAARNAVRTMERRRTVCNGVASEAAYEIAEVRPSPFQRCASSWTTVGGRDGASPASVPT